MNLAHPFEASLPWLTGIPTSWRVVPLFSLLSERKVRNTGGTGQTVLSLSYGSIVVRDVESNYGLLPESFETYQVVEPGNIVLRLTDLQNDKRSLRVGLVRQHGIITSAYLCLDVASHELNANYAYYLLHSLDIRKVFYSLGSGVRQSIGYVDLKRLPLILPPPTEQRAIATFLHRETARIDVIIDKKQRQIEFLEEKRVALISHAVTKGLEPNVKMKDSGVEWLGKIPEHWRVLPLKRVVRIREGQVDPRVSENSNLPLIAPNHIESGTGRVIELVSACDQGAVSGKYPFSRGEILYSKIRPALAKACIAPDDGLCSADMYPMTVAAGFLPQYVVFVLISHAFTAMAVNESMRVAMPKVNRETLGKLRFAFPSLREQSAIVEQLEATVLPIDVTVTAIRKSIGLFQEYRSSLISAAVTGQISVRGEAVAP
jgi:type I restriction enzyme S subunit